jgi:acyl-CoA synthetase (AMP-forming)/AMP-acid ligase II
MFDGSIRDHAHLTPRATAVITPARNLSYAEFNAEIDRFGAAMAELGIGSHTKTVSIAMDDPALTYILTAALARLRIPTSPFNDPGAEVRLVQDRPGAGLDAPGPRLITLSGDWILRARARPPAPLPVLPINPEAMGRVMLSSGTTRAPRRIAITWARMQAINLANFSGRGAGIHGVWAPLTTVESIQGFTLAISAWSQGSALAGGFRAPDIPGLMETRPVGLLGCTPTQLRGVLAVLPADFQPRPGWRVSVGGSRLPVALARDARLRLSPDVRVTYGATEATFNTLGLAARLEADPGYVGVALNGAILEFVDEAGRPVAEGESGEIRIRGPRVADGYLDDPDATAERFRDGWFYTRDVGRRLSDGRIILEGRLDDRMILAEMGKFMPAFLEDAALECPGVVDCAAFAVPNAAGLDQCWLAVVDAPGFDRESLAGHLARYPGLPPPRFAWIDEVPRNAMGKVQRGHLRDALIAARRADAGH